MEREAVAGRKPRLPGALTDLQRPLRPLILAARREILASPAARAFPGRTADGGFDVALLPVHSRSQIDFFSASGRLLIPRGQYITPEVAVSLAQAGITALYRDPSAGRSPARPRAPAAAGVDQLLPGLFEAAYVARVRRRLDADVEFGGPALSPPRSGLPISRTMRVWRGSPRPKATLAAYEAFYRRAAADLNRLWEDLAAGKYLWRARLARLVDETVNRFAAGREILAALAAADLKLPGEAAHALAAAVYSLGVGARLGLNRAQAADLVAAAFFHDVGHVMMPRELLAAGRGFSKAERRVVSRHVDHGLYLLARIDWPQRILGLALYQHHERVSGVGYPNGSPRERIHEYAAVLAVADVFHALVSDRPHRKKYLPSHAMKLVLKMAVVNLLDKKCVRALVDELSAYPVGTFVRLSNGETARVVAASREPLRPWVSTLFYANGQPPLVPRLRDLSRTPWLSVREELPPTGASLAGF